MKLESGLSEVTKNLLYDGFSSRCSVTCYVLLLGALVLTFCVSVVSAR